MGNHIVLPCGCKINETTVLSMCIGHHQELVCKNLDQEKRYNYWRGMMDSATSPQRRSHD